MGLLKRIDGVVDAAAANIAEPKNHRLAKFGLYFVIAITVAWVPYSIAHHVYTSGFHVVSVEQEERVGREYAGEMERSMSLIGGNNPMSLYISDVGSRVAAQHNPWLVTFNFQVVDDKYMANAFALPGGRIYITTGLLQKLDNEAELAAVLAHEVAHVSERHYARNMGRQMLISWAKKFLGGADRTMLEAGSFFATNVAFLRMRQQDELEADHKGALYIYALDYDPSAGVTLARKLLDMERQTPDLARAMAATHPPSLERIQAMENLTASLPHREGLTLGEERFKESVKIEPVFVPDSDFMRSREIEQYRRQIEFEKIKQERREPHG